MYVHFRLNERQRVANSPDFDGLGWWERTCNQMGVATLGNGALNALTYAVATTVAEDSFHILKGLLTPDRRPMLMIHRLGICLQ